MLDEITAVMRFVASETALRDRRNREIAHNRSGLASSLYMAANADIPSRAQRMACGLNQ